MFDLVPKLRHAFSRALGIPESEIVDDLRYNGRPEWDSVAHMALVAAIEDTFGIMFNTSEVLDMSSFEAARKIVARHLS